MSNLNFVYVKDNLFCYFFINLCFELDKLVRIVFNLNSDINKIILNIFFCEFFIIFFVLKVNFSNILVCNIVDIQIFIDSGVIKILLKALFLLEYFIKFLVNSGKKIQSFKVFKRMNRNTFFVDIKSLFK